MIRISQIAAPAIVGAALVVGAAGCASEQPKHVPVGAQMLTESKESAMAVAPDNGTVYVYDDNADKIVYSGKVEKGDRVHVDAKENRVLLDNQVVAERDLVNDHRFRVYFDDKDAIKSSADGATVIRHQDGTTVIQQGDGSTVVQPAPAAAPAGSTVVQPNGRTTVIQPAPQSSTPSGSTTVQPAAPAPGTPSGTTVVRPSDDTTVIQRQNETIIQPSR